MARWRWLYPITLAGLCLVLSPSVTAQESSPDKLLLRAADHVLVWSQTEGAAESIFRELGFNVRPGQEYPEGIGSSDRHGAYKSDGGNRDLQVTDIASPHSIIVDSYEFAC